MSNNTNRPAPSRMPKIGPDGPQKVLTDPRSANNPASSIMLVCILNSHLPVQINSNMKFSTPNHNAKKGLALHALS